MAPPPRRRKAQPRQPHEVAQVKLRLREPLRRQLERAANNHRVSLNNEIRFRLEDSFESRDVPRGYEFILDDMKITWARFSNRFIALTLEDQLADALSRSTDPAVANLARIWLDHRNIERRLEEGKLP